MLRFLGWLSVKRSSGGNDDFATNPAVPATPVPPGNDVALYCRTDIRALIGDFLTLGTCGDDRQSGEKSSDSELHLSGVAQESMVFWYCIVIVNPWIYRDSPLKY